jgi:hypothetical protein
MQINPYQPPCYGPHDRNRLVSSLRESDPLVGSRNLADDRRRAGARADLDESGSSRSRISGRSSLPEDLYGIRSKFTFGVNMAVEGLAGDPEFGA